MIIYLTHDCIDPTLWDECIACAPNGNVYAWSWYLDLVHPGWDALVVLIEGKYLAVMPITKKKKYGVQYLCQPFFAQQLGVFSVEPVTSNQTRVFLQAIPSKYRLVEICLNEGNPFEGTPKGVRFRRNHLLDLRSNYDILLSHYHENTKRNLKKSFKSDLELVKGVPMSKVIALFRANRGATVAHWGDEEYARLERLTAAAITSSNAFVYGIKNKDNEEIICGALFMKSHHRITFMFSGNNDEGKECQAMTFLIDQVIQEYAGQDFVFDFEGSDDDNLARFYLGFGSVPVSYPGITYRFRNPFRLKKTSFSL
jgi:hypothetical protein